MRQQYICSIRNRAFSNHAITDLWCETSSLLGVIVSFKTLFSKSLKKRYYIEHSNEPPEAVFDDHKNGTSNWESGLQFRDCIFTKKFKPINYVLEHNGVTKAEFEVWGWYLSYVYLFCAHFTILSSVHSMKTATNKTYKHFYYTKHSRQK